MLLNRTINSSAKSMYSHFVFVSVNDFKSNKHPLPLARIKKIMKSDEDVRMISAEAPVLFAKACEMFIIDLTMKAWAQTDAANRKALQRKNN